jgi:hypothetical protein
MENGLGLEKATMKKNKIIAFFRCPANEVTGHL